MTDDPLAYLHAAHAAAEALAASGESWTAFEESAHGTRRVDVDHSFERVVAATRAWRGGHIALHDPHAVLGRIKAERALIADLLSERHHVANDPWYTCQAATEERDGGEYGNEKYRGWPCDCGRDARVERRLRIMAEGWGWTEST